MALPALPTFSKQSCSPRAAAGFKFGVGSFRRMTTVALSQDSSLDQKPLQQELLEARYHLNETPGPGAYNNTGTMGASAAAPVWTIATKTDAEIKLNGAKNSLEKAWFHNSDPWKQKVDSLYRDGKWPEPASYRLPSIGDSDVTRPRACNFSFGSRDTVDRGTRQQPAPGSYNPRHPDANSRVCRIGERGDTKLWPPLLSTPGPGNYADDRVTGLAARAKRRRFTMRGPKQRVDYARYSLGPYFSF